MAKLEKPAAVERLDEIVARSDAVMVARGDLGVEMAPEKVPTIQRRILRACRAAGKPVIVATQMLESMIEAPTPTRAEASDVATAVYEGADAVMLSAKSAAGKYPLEAVPMMDRIIAEVEADPHYRKAVDAATPARADHRRCDLLRAAPDHVDPAGGGRYLLHQLGPTALRAARERPAAPILGLTSRLDTARRLSLVWGAHPVEVAEIDSVDDDCRAGLRRRAGGGLRPARRDRRDRRRHAVHGARARPICSGSQRLHGGAGRWLGSKSTGTCEPVGTLIAGERRVE